MRSCQPLVTSLARLDVVLPLCLGLGLAGFAGCAGPTEFGGQSHFAIAGTPPPPPPPAPPRVELKQDRIQINEKVQFDFDKATIKEVSFSLLDEVGRVIRDNPQLRKISIEGHASAEGGDAYNLDLSERRAKSVLDYLISHGIERDRLTSHGFGKTRPIADNDTAEGREKNRRVEFNIVERDESRAPPTKAATAQTGAH